MVLKSSTGIYGIRHIKSQRIYIGQGQNIYNRWSYHKSALKYKYHHCKYLQNMWNKYGADEFEFVILEECVVELLDEKEQYWMDSFGKKILNINKLAGHARGYTMSKETKKKMSEHAKRIAADPEERKRRSERAKAQHAAGKLGQKTWSEEVKEKMKEIGRDNLIKHGAKGRAKALGNSAEMSRRSYSRKIFKKIMERRGTKNDS